MSTFLYLEILLIEYAGLKLIYKSNANLKLTLTDLKPLPIGVVTGPFNATLYFLIASNVSSGISLPVLSYETCPISYL